MNKVDPHFWKAVARERQHISDSEPTESTVHNVLTGLDWLILNGGCSKHQLKSIKDNIKILEAKCNG